MKKKDLSVIPNFVKVFDDFSNQVKFLPSGVALYSGEVFENSLIVKMNEVPDLNILP